MTRMHEAPAMAAPIDAQARQEIARGYMLLGVFFIHSLYDMSENADPGRAMIVNTLIKLLAPHIAIFFVLSGLSARGIGRRGFRGVAQQSLMLIFVAWASQALGLALQDAICGGASGPAAFLRALLTPMLEGTEGVTYVTWFFTSLAVVRMLVWLFERDVLMFAAVCAAITIAIIAARALALPDNLYEWRHYPLCTLFMLVGIKFPPRWRVPFGLGVAALAVSAGLTWINRPELLSAGPCLRCDADFVAEPMIGGIGIVPVYILQEGLFFIVLIWATQLRWLAWPARVAQYFGRYSLQFLLLHGWLLVTLEPYIAEHFPPAPGRRLILAAFLLNPLVHAGAFALFQRPVNWVLAGCFRAARACLAVIGPAPVTMATRV